MTAAASRQKLHRDRQAAGRVVLRVEVDEVALAEQLIVAGFLEPADADDRAALAAALEHVVALWAGVTRNAGGLSDPLNNDPDAFAP